MRERYDRRTFVRRLAAAGLAVPSLPMLGCRDDGAATAGDDVESPSAGLANPRPILLPWPGDAVRIDAPLVELPMAYVSMGRREVFVDYAFRDRSNWILDAHISVSTGVWRIPLPGDPVGQPITPGDAMREFEELDMALWDPTMEPAVADFRIVRGRQVPVRIDFSCVPEASSRAWYSAGPLSVMHCDRSGDAACREDFGDVGEGARHPLRGCETESTPVRVMTWACPPGR